MLLGRGSSPSEHNATQISRRDAQLIGKRVDPRSRECAVVDAHHRGTAQIPLGVITAQPRGGLSRSTARARLCAGRECLVQRAHVAHVRRQWCACSTSRLADRAGVASINDDVEEPSDLSAIARRHRAVALAGVEVHALMLP